MKLEKLKKIDLRKAWNHEATDFTNWLAENENLSLLSDEIGIDIKLIQTEASVGKFNVDILAEEENTSRKIIIENQLEMTNHDHLGKVITYASGYDAEIMIWIVKNVRDEHKQAVDWLNEHTDEKINFFAIKMELWQIGDSSFAPKFQIISKPNDWAKTIKKSSKSGELSSVALQQLEFLNNFVDYCKKQNSHINFSKPQYTTPAYYSTGIGMNECYIVVKLNTKQGVLKIDVYFRSRNIFNALQQEKYKEIINEKIGEKLIWDERSQYNEPTVGTSINFNIDNIENWEKDFEWLKNVSEKLQKVFTEYVKKIK